MWNRIIHRAAVCTILSMGVVLAQWGRVEGAEREVKVPVRPVGLFHRIGWQHSGAHQNNDAEAFCEPENWRTKKWDESCWGGRLHNMTQQHSLNKEAWHLYIRGVGPAIHERPPGSPCYFW